MLVAGKSKNHLLGTTPEETALVDQWVSFGDNELAANCGFIFYLLVGYLPYSKPVSTSPALMSCLSDLIAAAPAEDRYYIP